MAAADIARPQTVTAHPIAKSSDPAPFEPSNLSRLQQRTNYPNSSAFSQLSPLATGSVSRGLRSDFVYGFSPTDHSSVCSPNSSYSPAIDYGPSKVSSQPYIPNDMILRSQAAAFDCFSQPQQQMSPLSSVSTPCTWSQYHPLASPFEGSGNVPVSLAGSVSSSMVTPPLYPPHSSQQLYSSAMPMGPSTIPHDVSMSTQPWSLVKATTY